MNDYNLFLKNLMNYVILFALYKVKGMEEILDGYNPLTC